MPKSRNRKKKTSKRQTNLTRKQHINPVTPDIVPNQSSRGQQFQARFYQGLIPSSDEMMRYREVQEDLPERILRMTENEGVHRRRYEGRVLNHFLITELSRTIAGLIAVGAIIWIAFEFLKRGYPDEGKIILITIVVSLASIFVLRKFFGGNSKK